MFSVYSGYKSRIRYRIWKYFFPLCGLPFHVLDNVPRGSEVFHFDEVPFNYDFFGCLCFGVVAKKPLPNPRSQRFASVFPSESFIVSTLTFMSLKHLKFILHVGWGRSPISLFCMWKSSCRSHSCQKGYSYQIITWALFPGSSPCPRSVCLSSSGISLTYYCSFAVTFEMSSVDSPVCSLSRLFCQFWIPRYSMWLLGSACQFPQQSSLRSW